MKVFTCPDGLVLALDKITYIEHLVQDGYKTDSPWKFAVHFIGGSKTYFPSSASDTRMYGYGEGNIGWQSFTFKAVDRVRNELVKAMEAP